MRFIILFIVLLMGLLNPSMAQDDRSKSLTMLRGQLSQASTDTSRINILFKMGYEYLDGPSDSLLFYFGDALEIINRNLDGYENEEIGNEKMIGVFRKYRIRALIEFGIEHFFKSDYPDALNYYFKALEEAEVYGDVALVSECFSEIGIVYKNQGEYDLALQYYDKALETARLTRDTSWIASCQVNIGNVYKSKGYLTVAQNYYIEALKALEKLEHHRRISSCYQNIGDIYHKQRDYQIALEYYSRSLELAKSYDFRVSEFTCYLNIGYVYLDMGYYSVSRDYLNQAVELYKNSGYQHELDNAFLLLGDTYLHEKDFEEAIAYYYKALTISTQEKDKARIAEVKSRIGEALMNTGRVDEALPYFQSSLKEADSVGFLDLMIESNLKLAQFYEKTEQFDKAIFYQREYARLKDTLFNAEKYKSIMEMEVKYNTEKQEQEMALLAEKNKVQYLKLNRRNRLYYSTLIGIALLLLVGYVLFRNRRLRIVQRSIELEQKLMRSQMNPHFIFNSLIAIQSYIYKQEAVKAGDYLARFAELIRITLESSRGEFVSLEKELKMLNAYLELQGMRFENKFDYRIILDEGIYAAACLIPPMMAQPFIENAIEHGLRHRETKGNLSITFKKEGNDLYCIVEDDGIGRKKARELNKKKKHKSMATSITKDRLNILSKKDRKKYVLVIEDLMENNTISKGTRVTFNMPHRIQSLDD